MKFKLKQDKIKQDIFLINNIREKHNEFNIPSNCFFLGAGCSYSSGIPLGSGVIDICKKLSFKKNFSVDPDLDRKTNESIDVYVNRVNEFVKESQEEFNKFVKDKEKGFRNKLSKENTISGLPNNVRLRVSNDEKLEGEKLDERLFEMFEDDFHKDGLYGNWLEEYNENKGKRQELIEDLIENKKPDGAYYYFSNFMQSGFIHNVFTVNFDDLLNEALLKYMDIKARVFSQNEIASYISITSLRPNIIKLHGDYSFENIQNLTLETYNLQPNMERKLEETLSRLGLVVVGYNGADHSVMKVLEKIKMKDNKEFLLMWCGRDPDDLHWRVINLINETANSYFIQIQDFESFVSKLYAVWKTTAKDIEDIAKENKKEINKFKSKFIDTINKKADVTDSEKIQINNLVEADKYFDLAYAEKDGKKQIELYTKAIELNPKYADAYNNRGNAHEKLDENDKALADYDIAIDLNPVEYVYTNRGILYDKLKENDKALEDYNKAITLNPKYAAAYNNRGRVYQKLKENDKALADYNRAVELNPNDEIAFNNRGTIYHALNEDSKAFDDYNKAIELNPDYQLAYNNRGAVYLKQKKYDNAEKEYLKAIELKPDNYQYYISLAEFYLLISDYANSLETLNKAQDKIKEKDYELILYFLKCVVLKFLNKDASDAEAKFNELMNEDIDVPWSFDEIEEFLKTNKTISKEKKKYMEDKIKLLKEKQKK